MFWLLLFNFLVKGDLFSFFKVALEICDLWVINFSYKSKILGEEYTKGFLDVGSYISILKIFDLPGNKLFQFGFFDGFSIIISQNLSGSIDSSKHIEEASRILSSSIQFIPIIKIPFIRITFSITCSWFPVLCLISPVNLSYYFVFGKGGTQRIA